MMLVDEPTAAHTSRHTPIVEWGMFTIALCVVVAVLQLRDGAYGSEFEVMDDARHYITGLAFLDYLRDFLASFSPLSPLGFLSGYQSHYPALGIGHWPPLFYVVESIWMLVFQWSRVSVLALSAVILIALAGLTYGFVRDRFGRVPGAFAAFVVAASPIHQIGRNSLMLDIPVALLCFLAMGAYIRYLNSGRWSSSITFALLAVAAIMVKGNGFCLALVPPIAVLIARRFDLLRRPSFWIPIPIVIALTAPWYLLTYRQEVASGFIYAWGLHFIQIATIGNTRLLVDACGPLLVVAAFVGFIGVIAAMPRSRPDNGLVGAAALFAATITFQSVVPTDVVARYLTAALAPLVILAIFGLELLAGRLIAVFPKTRSLLPNVDRGVMIGTVLLAASFAPLTVEAHPKPSWGLIETARTIWEHRIAANPSLLVALDQLQEPALLAELAMLDKHRPSLFALSSVRLLVAGGFRPGDYVLRFENPEQVMAAIDDYAIPYVVLSSNDRGRPHVAQLAQIDRVRDAFPDRWELVRRVDGANSAILIYRIIGNQSKQADTARLFALTRAKALDPENR